MWVLQEQKHNNCTIDLHCCGNSEIPHLPFLLYIHDIDHHVVNSLVQITKKCWYSSFMKPSQKKKKKKIHTFHMSISPNKFNKFMGPWAQIVILTGKAWQMKRQTDSYLELIHSSCIALVKALFFQFKSIDIFLISPQKHMLWVLIRSPSLRHF